MARSVYSAHHSHQCQREAFFNLRHFRTLSTRNHTNGSRFFFYFILHAYEHCCDSWCRRWCRRWPNCCMNGMKKKVMQNNGPQEKKKQKQIFVLFQRRIPPSILCSSYTFSCLLFVDKYFFPSIHVAVVLFTRYKKQETVKSRTDYDLSKLLTKMLFSFSNKLIGKYVRKYSF